MRKTLALALLMTLFVTGCTQQSTVVDTSDNGASDSTGNNLADLFNTDMFTLATEYTDPSSWSYTLTADMPNPCYGFEVEALVMESYPEQVTLNITIQEPAAGVVCAQVIDTQTVTGTFSASEVAIIQLQLET